MGAVVAVKGLLIIDTTRRWGFRAEPKEIELKWRSGLFLYSILNSFGAIRENDVSGTKTA